MNKFLAILLLLPALSFAGNKTITLNENNTINFNQAFGSQFVAAKQLEAINLCIKNGGQDIYIALYTPGGSISAGQRFFDTLNALPCTFHTITIFSASMGYQTVQNLGTRYILPSGILMSHRASIRGLSGEVGGELDSIYNLIKQNVFELEEVAAKRVGISIEKYQSDISDELWLTGTKAVETNHADEVALVQCEGSLLGTELQRIPTVFGVFLVEFSKCPIITGPLSVQRASRDNPNDIIDYYTNIKDKVEYSL